MVKNSSSSPSTSSGRPVHAPSRFEATGEKDRNRVEGGKKAAATRGQQVHDDEDEQVSVEEIGEVDRHGNDLIGADFHPGKNPTRSAASKRVAKERGHEAFVEQGKKGGASNKGIHAGQINGLDADDMTTYLEHPEVGVPEKNPNRVLGGKKAAETRGDQVHGEANVGPNAGGNTRGNTRKQEEKDPVRVEAGKKAARTRGLHVHDDDDNNDEEEEDEDDEEEDDDEQDSNQHKSRQQQHNRNRNSSASSSSRQTKSASQDRSHHDKDYEGKNPNRVEGGKKAAKTRGQHVHDEDEEEDDERSHHDKDYEGKNPNRVEGGKKAARTRGQQVHDDDDDDQSHHGKDYQGKNPNRVEGGKKAARTRGQHVHDEDDDENDESEDSSSSSRSHHDKDYEGKNPNRVEGGKKAASKRSHEDFVEMGRKGGLNSGKKNSSSDESHHDKDYEGKNPNRVEGGKKAARARGQQVHDDEDDDQSHHDKDYEGKNPNRVEGGKKAARTRGQHVHDDDDNEDDDDSESHDSHNKSSSSSRSSSSSSYGQSGQDRSTQGPDGKNPNRVRGGKKAALTRGDHVEDADEFDLDDDSSSSSNRRSSSSSSTRNNFSGASTKNRKNMVDDDADDAEYDDSKESRESVYTHGGFGLNVAGVREDGKSGQRVRGGQSAALQRGFNVKRGEEEIAKGNPNRIEGGKKAASQRSHEDFVEMGKKGGRVTDTGATYDHLTADGKNPNRVAGGYKAARARGDATHEYEHEQDEMFDEDSYDSTQTSHHDKDYAGKNPNRVAGGKKAASKRSHEDFVEMGKKGAASRFGQDSLHDKESHYGEESSKTQGNYQSRRESDTNIHSPAKRSRAVY